MNRYVISSFIASAALAGALSSCGLKKEHIEQAPPVKVKVMPVADSATGSLRTYTGTVASGSGAEVSFTIPGTIKAIYVKEGDKVSKGQLLAEIKDETLVNNHNIAKSALNEAQDSYNRFKKLHDANALADMKWVEVQNALQAAKNAEEVAARAVGDAKIYAPVSGTVAKKLADAGQTALPAVPVLSLVTLGDVKVTIPVPEDEIASMQPGQKAAITFDALNGRQLQGTLSEKGVMANPLTRAYDVKFSVDNADGSLLPGMICSVNIEGDGNVGSAIVLPAQSVLLSADNRNFVWLARNGHAEQHFVEAPDMTAEGIIITSGLQKGDTVIIAGMQKVSNGTSIVTEL